MFGGLNKIIILYNKTAVAVLGLFHRLFSFVFMPIIGLNQGYMPIIGYNFGHRNVERMKQCFKYGMTAGFLISMAGCIIFQVFPEALIRIFNDDPELIEVGTTALRRISLGFPFAGITLIGLRTFQALGYGLPTLIIDVMSRVLLLLPLAYILAEWFGFSALWYAFPFANLFTACTAVVWLMLVLRKILKTKSRITYSV
jgi:Na+-driven multidrug efflux pump